MNNYEDFLDSYDGGSSAYSMAYRMSSMTTWTTIAFVLAIIATVVAAILLMPQNKAKVLNKFWYFIHRVINFKNLLLESILKVLYIFSTVYGILFGLFMIFQGIWYGILVLLISPFVIRIMYELIMMFIILVNNTIEIRKKLTDDREPDNTSNTQIQHDYQFCSVCGTRYDAATGNCPNCKNI